MCHVFSPSHAVLSAILRDEYLTSVVRTKEGEKAGSKQPPRHDPVQFKLELTPNYLISYLENTEISQKKRSWGLQDQLSQHDRCACWFKSTNQRIATKQTSVWVRVVVLNCQWSRYTDWWIWIDAHTSNAFGWDFCTGHVEKAGLATSGSLFSRNFGRIELSFGWGMDTYLVDREPVFSR